MVSFSDSSVPSARDGSGGPSAIAFSALAQRPHGLAGADEPQRRRIRHGAPGAVTAKTCGSVVPRTNGGSCAGRPAEARARAWPRAPAAASGCEPSRRRSFPRRPSRPRAWAASMRDSESCDRASRRSSSGRSTCRLGCGFGSGSRPKRGSLTCSSSTKYQPALAAVGMSGPRGSVTSKPKKLRSVPIVPRNIGHLRCVLSRPRVLLASFHVAGIADTTVFG